MNTSKPKKSWVARLAIGATVVFIVCCLGLIIFPFNVTSKAIAKNTACISNLKQIDTAILIYASDHNDALPPFYTFEGADQGNRFKAVVSSYRKSSSLKHDYQFQCPSFEHPNDDSVRMPGPEGVLGSLSYVHCLSLRGIIPGFSTGSRILTLYGLSDPENIHYLRDPICGFGSAKDKDGTAYPGVLYSPHGEGFNMANLDGHAKYKILTELNTDL